MRINTADLERALAKANEVNEHYRLTHLVGGDTQKYLDYVIESCAAVGFPGTVRIVELQDVQRENSAVYSASVMLEDGNLDIVIVRDLNHCWTRYVVCKELFHALLDCDQYRNLDIAAHTEAVSVTFPMDNATADVSIQVEFLAEIAAMEFLFPFARRQLLIKGGNPDFKSIAQAYRIPQTLVEKYLSAHYIEALRAFSKQAA